MIRDPDGATPDPFVFPEDLFGGKADVKYH